MSRKTTITMTTIIMEAVATNAIGNRSKLVTDTKDNLKQQ